MQQRFSASSAGRLMACHGSANLSKAIPGWVAPEEDPNKFKAKGVGTLIHAFLELAAQSNLFNRMEAASAIYCFQALHHSKRKIFSDNYKSSIHLAMSSMQTGLPASKMDAYVRFNRINYRFWSDRSILFTVFLEEYAALLTPKQMRFIVDCMDYYNRRPLGELPSTSSMDVVRSVRSGLSQHTVLEGNALELKMPSTWLDIDGDTTVDVVTWLVTVPTSPSGARGVDAYLELEVIDYKTGVIPIPAVDNDQLYFYLASALDHVKQLLFQEYMRTGVQYRLSEERTTLVATILQPDNFSQHTLDEGELEDWQAKAVRSVKAIQGGDLTLTPSDNCTFCPANPRARGERAAPYCPEILAMYHEDITDESDILSI